MTNAERDEMIRGTHDAVIGLKSSSESRDKICEAHAKQIATLFEGYNQTQKNSTMIKVISVIGGFVGSACLTMTGWFVARN